MGNSEAGRYWSRADGGGGGGGGRRALKNNFTPNLSLCFPISFLFIFSSFLFSRINFTDERRDDLSSKSARVLAKTVHVCSGGGEPVVTRPRPSAGPRPPDRGTDVVARLLITRLMEERVPIISFLLAASCDWMGDACVICVCGSCVIYLTQFSFR